jgi:predicted O-linked N-acetylglucosamine transferase (SPINDLY family)
MLGWLLKSLAKKAMADPAAADPDRRAAARRFALGLQHHQAGRLGEAQLEYAEALRLDPESIDALHFSGVVAYQQGRHEEARELISRALSLNAANPPAHNNLGNVLRALGRFEDAAASFEQAIALKADYLDAHVNLAGLRLARSQPGRAVAACERALQALPGGGRLRLQLAQGLLALDRYDEAIAAYREAAAREPESSAAHAGLGYALRQSGRLDEAILSYRKAAAVDARAAGARYDLGDLLGSIDRVEEAVACFRDALSADPEFAEARWALTMAQLPAIYESEADAERCRGNFARELEALETWMTPVRLAACARAVGVQQPFYLAYQERDNRQLLARYGALCARAMDAWRRGQGFVEPSPAQRGRGRIRVGVVSAHFRNHSVWNAIVKGWFRGLDPGRFELEAFHLGSARDAETEYAKARAAAFHDSAVTPGEWAQTILDRRPDVLIYPEIGMDPTTVKLASLRLAPVQVAAWGHPETSGLPTIDCYLSARGMEPADAQAHYTERLVALPHLGCECATTGAVALAPPPVDAAPGVPVLVCPGVPFKYAPGYDALLIAIARTLGRCRFVFFSHRSAELSRRLRERLERAFRREGLDFGRFGIFLPWLDRGTFLGLLQSADAMLDTVGFSGFNTALQAVEAGLPIVAMEGRFLRGRLASGILRRMGLDELVARSADEYVTLAARVAADAAYRDQLRARIAERRGLVFGDEAPIRALETFLAEAAAR